MKKTYMKPTMESEMFATNEYVAACQIVTCNRFYFGKQESFIIKKEPTATREDDDGFYQDQFDNWYYNGAQFQHKHTLDDILGPDHLVTFKTMEPNSNFS